MIRNCDYCWYHTRSMGSFGAVRLGLLLCSLGAWVNDHQWYPTWWAMFWHCEHGTRGRWSCWTLSFEHGSTIVHRLCCVQLIMEQDYVVKTIQCSIYSQLTLDLETWWNSCHPFVRPTGGGWVGQNNYLPTDGRTLSGKKGVVMTLGG